jgi:hypothetical protein
MADTSLETQVTEQVERFMRNLLDAGMGIEQVVEHGYTYARECYGHYVCELQDRYPFAYEADLEASNILAHVAHNLKIGRKSAQEQWEAHSTLATEAREKDV